MGSCVPPALTITRLPARSAFTRSAWLMAVRMSSRSARRPLPCAPQAREPVPGSTTLKPRARSLAMFSCVMPFSHMFTFMAGARMTGALVASTEQVSMSSAMPAASLAMTLAVAGAMTTTLARSARAMCSISNSSGASNMSVTVGRWVMLLKLRGVTNSVAHSVMTTSTLAPACVNLLARSTAL